VTRYVGIDPSTKTGLVILSPEGKEIIAGEIEGIGEDPHRMNDIIYTTMSLIKPGDIVCIEGFGYASQSGFLLGGIGWGIRLELYRQGIDYWEVSPNGLKKFSGAGGTAKKPEVAVETYKRWGFQCKSDNVIDAYVLAQIARAMHEDIKITKFQQEVINAIKNPKKKSKKKKERK
jgi:crossover junction endodeoxyribonuclease RuvC